jgi:hypothetical protein
LLEGACARNLSAEIEYEAQGLLRRAWTRLLRVDEDQIVILQPEVAASELELRPDQQVTVHVAVGEKLYGFQTHVIRLLTGEDPGSGQSTRQAALQVPKHVHKEQRRLAYRVPLAEYRVQAAAHPVNSDLADACPINAKRCNGWLANASASGTLLVIDTLTGAPFKVHDALYIIFKLPGFEDRFVLPVEVRHIRRDSDGQRAALGLQFRDAGTIENRRQVQRIQRFLADEQRRQIRGHR